MKYQKEKPVFLKQGSPVENDVFEKVRRPDTPAFKLLVNLDP